MSIARTREAAAAGAMARAILAERLPLDLARAIGTGPFSGHIAVLPIHALDADAVRDRELGRSRRIGWRYLWVGIGVEQAAALDIGGRRGANCKLTRYQFGRSPRLLADRFAEAAASIAVVGKSYRARLLKPGPPGMEALWLCRGDEHRLFDVHSSLEDDAFLNHVLQRQRERRKA